MLLQEFSDLTSIPKEQLQISSQTTLPDGSTEVVFDLGDGADAVMVTTQVNSMLPTLPSEDYPFFSQAEEGIPDPVDDEQFTTALADLLEISRDDIAVVCESIEEDGVVESEVIVEFSTFDITFEEFEMAMTNFDQNGFPVLDPIESFNCFAQCEASCYFPFGGRYFGTRMETIDTEPTFQGCCEECKSLTNCVHVSFQPPDICELYSSITRFVFSNRWKSDVSFRLEPISNPIVDIKIWIEIKSLIKSIIRLLKFLWKELTGILPLQLLEEDGSAVLQELSDLTSIPVDQLQIVSIGTLANSDTEAVFDLGEGMDATLVALQLNPRLGTLSSTDFPIFAQAEEGIPDAIDDAQLLSEVAELGIPPGDIVIVQETISLTNAVTSEVILGFTTAQVTAEEFEWAATNLDEREFPILGVAENIRCIAKCEASCYFPFGGRYFGTRIETINAHSAFQDCCEECKSNDDCIHVSFQIPDICELYSAVTRFVFSRRWSSDVGFRLKPIFDIKDLEIPIGDEISIWIKIKSEIKIIIRFIKFVWRAVTGIFGLKLLEVDETALLQELCALASIPVDTCKIVSTTTRADGSTEVVFDLGEGADAVLVALELNPQLATLSVNDFPMFSQAEEGIPDAIDDSQLLVEFGELGIPPENIVIAEETVVLTDSVESEVILGLTTPEVTAEEIRELVANLDPNVFPVLGLAENVQCIAHCEESCYFFARGRYFGTRMETITKQYFQDCCEECRSLANCVHVSFQSPICELYSSVTSFVLSNRWKSDESSPPPTPAPTPIIDCISFPGGLHDINAPFENAGLIPTYDECCEECDDLISCIHISYRPHDGLCLLHGESTGFLPSNAWISDFKTCEPAEGYYTGDFEETTAESFTDCCIQCNNVPDCVLVSFKGNEEKRCFLFSHADGYLETWRWERSALPTFGSTSGFYSGIMETIQTDTFNKCGDMCTLRGDACVHFSFRLTTLPESDCRLVSSFTEFTITDRWMSDAAMSDSTGSNTAAIPDTGEGFAWIVEAAISETSSIGTDAASVPDTTDSMAVSNTGVGPPTDETSSVQHGSAASTSGSNIAETATISDVEAAAISDPEAAAIPGHEAAGISGPEAAAISDPEAAAISGPEAAAISDPGANPLPVEKA